MPKHARIALTIFLGALAPLACSPADDGKIDDVGNSGFAGTSGGGAGTTGAAGTGQQTAGTTGNTGTAGTGQQNTGTAGTTGAGGTGQGTAGTTGNTGTAGTTGGAGTSGAAGTGTTGVAGTTGGAAGTGVAPGDTAPWRALNVTGEKKQRTHSVFGNTVGLDNRSAQMAGKLIIDLGVDSGGYLGFLGKRGFHVFGVKFYHCAHIDAWGAPYGREYHANCRLTTFDGVKRGGAENDANANVTPETSIAGKVKSGLAMLHQMYPEEDWGYFLNMDGSVRWSDVGFTGYSHGAQTAAALAHLVRLYRAVSRSGPRDNNCGTGTGVCPPAANAPPYNPNCPDSGIAAWQDMPFVTPVERCYSFAGTQDGQYGDDQFSTFRMKYPGQVVDIGKPGPYNSNRYCANAGHGGFDSYTDAINEAFGVLPANRNPTF